MVKLVLKSLKSFIAEEKVLALFLVSSLCIGNFIYFYTTEGLLKDEEQLSNHISVNITGLSQLQDIREIIVSSSKELDYFDIVTEASIVGMQSGSIASNYYVSCSMLDPELKNIDFISETVPFTNQDKYIVFSNIGQNILSYVDEGEEIFIAATPVKYIGSGLINFPNLIIGAMNENGFFDIFSRDSSREFIVYAYYDVDARKKDIITAGAELEKMGLVPIVTLYEPPSFGEVLSRYKESAIVISLVISMIIYGHYINSRLRDYSIFRIKGISKNRLTLLYLSEIFVIFSVSFWMIAFLWYIHLKIIGNGTYNLNLVCIYGFLLLNVIYTIINIPYLHMLSSDSVMDLFRKSKRIG